MGLIHQATLMHRPSTGVDADKKKTGLLEHLLKPAGYDVVRASFFSFLETMGAERAGILFPSDSGRLILLFSAGFDITTVNRFSPDSTFLSAIVPSGEWKSFTQQEIEPFKSFFSSSEYASVIAIHLREIPLADEKAYIVLAESLRNVRRTPIGLALAESGLASLEAAVRDQKIALVAMSKRSAIRQTAKPIRDHATAALDSGKKGTLLSISFSELFHDPVAVHTDSEQYEIYATIRDRIVRQAGSLNLVSVLDSNDIRVVVFSGAPVDAEMYSRQLMKPMEKIFGIDRIRKVRFRVDGTSDSLHEITSFLNGED